MSETISHSESYSSNPPIVSHKNVLAIAIPITLSYLTTPLLGIVDVSVIGQLNNAAMLGGIGIGSLIIGIFFTSLNFLRMSTTSLTAQAIGAKNFKELESVLMRALLLALLLAFSLWILFYPISYILLSFFSASNSVTEFAKIYITIRIIAAPLTLVNFVFSGWFMGQAKSWVALIHQTILNIVNILATIIFVVYLDFGVSGAAWGTVIGELFGMIAGAILAFSLVTKNRLKSGLYIQFNRTMKISAWIKGINFQGLRELINANSHVVIRSFALIASFSLFTRQSAQLGDDVLAANEILLQFFYFVGFFSDGFAVTAEQFCGQSLGAKSKNIYVKSVRYTLFWNVILSITLAFVFLLFGRYYIDYVTDLESVLTIAYDHFYWIIITPILGVLAFHFDGVFFGSYWLKDLRNMMLFSFLVFFLLIFGFLIFDSFNNHVLWMSFNLFMLTRGLGLLAAYNKNLKTAFK